MNFSYDGFIFHHHRDSKYGHPSTSLATSEGSPLAVGGESIYGHDFDGHNKVEKFDISANTWTEVDEYPYME